MIEVLGRYLPEEAIIPCFELIKKHGVHLKIVDQRLTRHGDYRKLSGGGHLITINAGPNPYRFLITLIHELAHLVAFIEYGQRIAPHGIEWKTTFKEMILPFINPAVFPKDLLPVLAKHFKNPKASSSGDPVLDKYLALYDTDTTGVFIEDLAEGTLFSYRENRKFRKGIKRRKRFECIEIATQKMYLFQPNSRVIPLPHDNESRKSY